MVVDAAGTAEPPAAAARPVNSRRPRWAAGYPAQAGRWPVSRRRRACRALAPLLLAAVVASWAAVAFGQASGAGKGTRGAAETIGVNLPAVSDWSATPVYVDLVHQARRFGSPDAPWDEAAAIGADGWPSGDFGIFLMTGQFRVSGTAGTYAVRFRGKAEIGVVASNARVVRLSYDATSDRSTAEVVVAEGADQFALKFTRTRGGIKDLQVIRPGYSVESPPLFTRALLDHLAPFSTLRFMDWLATNHDSGSRDWGTRPTPSRVRHASQAGVPWEHVIALANLTGKDIWINVPVRADDDYVRQLARLLKSTLRPASRIYVEYSNELWNGGYPQFQVNAEAARREVSADPRSPLAYDGTTDAQVLAFRRVAHRLKRISDIFRAEYGDAAMMRTVRPVLAGQVVQPHVLEVGLSFIDAVYGPPARFFYAVAGAPYFNLGPTQTADRLTVGDVIRAMDTSIGDLAVVNAFEKNRALASWYGLHWMAYEGGADTFGPGSIAAKAAAQMDPRIESLCLRYLRLWREAGGELFMWYTAGAGQWNSRFGAYELTDDLANAEAPKLRCLEKAMVNATPAARAPNVAPGSFAAGTHVGRAAGAEPGVLRHLHAGQHVDYLVLAEQAGDYAPTLLAEAAQPGNRIAIAVNNAPVAAEVELPASGWGASWPQPMPRLQLNAGFNTVRLTTRAETSGFILHRITLGR